MKIKIYQLKFRILKMMKGSLAAFVKENLIKKELKNIKVLVKLLRKKEKFLIFKNKD